MLQKVFQNGLPFQESLADSIQSLSKRIDGNKSAMIILDGGLGEGKTSLMIHAMDHCNKIHGLAPVDIGGPQLAMGGVDFLKKMRVCYEKKLPCIGYDEAGDFSKRGSLTQFNAMLNRTFETFRAFKCLVFIALPHFNVLDQEILDKNIPRLLLHLKDRNENYGNYSGYSLYRMHLLKARMSKFNIKNYAYTTVWPNFKGHFYDLDSERSKQLDKLSTKNKLEILRKSEVKIEGLLTYPELATKLFKSIDWVRRAANNLKIKPARSIGRIKYFNTDALNLLSEHLDMVTEKGHEPKRK